MHDVLRGFYEQIDRKYVYNVETECREHSFSLWFAEGLAVRTYSDLTFGQKIRKFFIPLREVALIRWSYVVLRRLFRSYLWFGRADKKPQLLRYRRLHANYEVFWQSDSDACNSLDPFDVILWFRSRGIVCRGYDSLLRALMVRTAALEFQK